MVRIEKTVFISYRRADESWALAIFQDLTQHGYDVFIDYDGIASGKFEAVILENIRARAHFIVLLTPTALEHWGDPKDWMRREIEAALDNRRNIVPLMLEGFDFSTPAIATRLTGKLAELNKYNGIVIPKGYFAQAMRRLRDKFLNVLVDVVLHPASLPAQQAAAEQKEKTARALGKALHQPWLPEEPRKQKNAAAQHRAEEERRRQEAEDRRRLVEAEAEKRRQEEERRRLEEWRPRTMEKQQVRVLRIVVASPGDVQAERKALPDVIDEINRGVAADRNLRLELSRWETDAYPGFHAEGPQGEIDTILRIDDCDLLIGIFWHRFGTPTMDAASGTEHEFRLAYQAWQRSRRPQIMVYFNDKAYSPQSKEETDQWGRVLEFKSNFPKEGLWWPYRGSNHLASLVRNHVTQYVRTLHAPWILPEELQQAEARRVAEAERRRQQEAEIIQRADEEERRRKAAPVGAKRASESLAKLIVRGPHFDEKLQIAQQPWREIGHCRFYRDFDVAADPVFDLVVENTSGGRLLLLKIGIRILQRKPGTGGVMGYAQPIKVQAEYSVHCHEGWKRFNLNDNESWVSFQDPWWMEEDAYPFRVTLCLENFCDTDSASSSEIRFCLQTSSGTVESESIWLEQ